MASEPKRQEPDIPPQKPDIQPEPTPQEFPKIRMSQRNNLRPCSFRDLRCRDIRAQKKPGQRRAGRAPFAANVYCSPSTMKESESVVFIRAASTAFCSSEFFQACAFSGLSN